MADKSHAGRHVARRYIAFSFFLAQDAVAHDRSGRPDDAPALGRTTPLSIMVSARLDPTDRDVAERRPDEFGKADEFRRHVLDQIEKCEQRGLLVQNFD